MFLWTLTTGGDAESYNPSLMLLNMATFFLSFASKRTGYYTLVTFWWVQNICFFSCCPGCNYKVGVMVELSVVTLWRRQLPSKQWCSVAGTLALYVRALLLQHKAKACAAQPAIKDDSLSVQVSRAEAGTIKLDVTTQDLMKQMKCVILVWY